MAIPSEYTEEELKTYMLGVLQSVGPASEWTTDDFDEEVIDVLLQYGVTDISQATDIGKLRAIARVISWRKLMSAVSGDFDFSADGGQYSRSQVFKQAQAQLSEAERSAADYLTENAAVIGSMVFYDPYQTIES